MSEELHLQAISDAFDRDRLRQARTLAQLKKHELARRVGLSAAAIGQYESGVTKPRAEHLPALAKELSVDVSFFAAGRPLFRVDSGDVHFRSLRSMRAVDRDLALSTVEQVRELTHLLERYVEFPEVLLPSVVAGTSPATAAAELREHWAIGPGPVAHLVATAESNGVVVLVSKQGAIQRVDAFSTFLVDRPIIFSTPRNSLEVYRHRFTVAHELGHLLLHGEARPGDKGQEIEADEFAAAFLTPAQELDRILPRRIDLAELDRIGRYWGVSVESLLMRMRELRGTPETTLRRAYQRWSLLKEGRSTEPLTAYPGEVPSLLREAVRLADAEAGMSLAAIANELRLPVGRIRELLGSEDSRPKLHLVR